MNVRRAFSFSFALAAIAFAAEPVGITAEGARDRYKTFAKGLTKPRLVDAQFGTLCIPQTGVHRLIKETGPHAEYRLQYYLNDVAQLHRELRSDRAYPPGSVIVKEKLVSAEPGQFQEPKVGAVAGMIKREPGSSPQTGDWEFFYFDADSLAATKNGVRVAWRKATELKSCVSCHSNVADMVFGGFDKPYQIPEANEEKVLRLEVSPKANLIPETLK